jgi:hypothetical protein
MRCAQSALAFSAGQEAEGTERLIGIVVNPGDVYGEPNRDTRSELYQPAVQAQPLKQKGDQG